MPSQRLEQPGHRHGRDLYEAGFVQALFEKMGPTYEYVNLFSSFGFSEFWRYRCVRGANIRPGDRVCDMMAGTGECWKYALRAGGSLVSIDFCEGMVARQRVRNARYRGSVDARREDALRSSIATASMDKAVCAFGLKTLNANALSRFAVEIHRILKPGGRVSALEISMPDARWLQPFYRWYLNVAIPAVGRVCLGDIDSYRMLGIYTAKFGSCASAIEAFRAAGFEVSYRRHFFGCATSLVGLKRD